MVQDDHRGDKNWMKMDKGNILEASGMFDTLIYLLTVEECRKSDLYKGIGRGSEMIHKLDRLENAGLIQQRKYNRVTFLSLTDEGRQVARYIAIIQGIIDGTEPESSGH